MVDIQVQVEMYGGRVLKVWWHAATLFIYFYIIRADIQYLYILLGEYHSSYLHCFRSVEGLLWGAEPRFERFGKGDTLSGIG
jgi:hypothetical protein